MWGLLSSPEHTFGLVLCWSLLSSRSFWRRSYSSRISAGVLFLSTTWRKKIWFECKANSGSAASQAADKELEWKKFHQDFTTLYVFFLWNYLEVSHFLLSSIYAFIKHRWSKTSSISSRLNEVMSYRAGGCCGKNAGFMPWDCNATTLCLCTLWLTLEDYSSMSELFLKI